MIGACAGITNIVTLKSLDGAIQDRFGKRYVASGGTATLDEAIKKKYAKKEMLLKANNDTIIEGHKIATEWAKTQNLQLVEV